MKYAMTMDGKIACYTGDSKWVTGEESRAHVQTLRNHYKGIMAGIGTVLAAFTMGKGIAIVGNVMDKHIAIAPYITNHIRRHGSHNAQYAGH